jgi:elongation factor 1 alpha-like protein
LQLELHVHHAKVSAGLVRIVSLLDQKTGKALAKKPRLLTARQAAIVEVRDPVQKMRLNARWFIRQMLNNGGVVCQVKLERVVCVEEFSALKALGRVFLRSQGCTIAVGVVTRVHELQEEA